MATNLREYMLQIPAYQLTMEDIATSNLRGLVERYSEQKCAYIPMPEDRVLCKVLGKYLMWVDAYDRGLSPHLMLRGYWEMWITTAIARYTKPNSTVIDVGANVGYYTMLLADAVGPHGRVVAFEPNPRISQMLKMSVSINGYSSRVDVREEAVSAPPGDGLAFAISKYEPKNSALVRNHSERSSFIAQYGDDVEFIRANLLSLDSLDLNNVGIVKIDAEGAEIDIWHGLQRTIDNNPDICIVLEVNSCRDYDLEDFHRVASEQFEVRHIDYDGNIRQLTTDMIKSTRRGEDWMLFLCRN